MIKGISKEVESVVWHAARACLPEAVFGSVRLANAVIARSRRYTSERDQLDAPPADPDGDLAARALFFSVCDAAKISVPIAELAGRGLLPERPLKVLDAGCGTGAMSIGLALATTRPLDITGIDIDQRALDIFDTSIEFLEEQGLIDNVTLETEKAAVTEYPLGAQSFDLVIAGSVLNELDEPAQRSAVIGFLHALKPDGALILIEPALRDTSRNLHALRDFILREQRGHVFAPCTRHAAPCPALEDERDWCHEDRPIQLPPRAAELGAKTGLRENGMKFSYLVLTPTERDLVEAGDLRAWRVVSQSRRLKGKRECFLCSDLGRVRMTLLKRNRNDGNRDFEHARRGDVLLIDRDAESAIDKETRVDCIHPARPG